MPGTAQVVDVAGRRVRLTNLDKVMYPETGTTKGEVIAYYSAVAEHIMPLLAGRPVTRKRWVDGVGTTDAPADAFFAKQVEPGTPSWVPHRTITHSDGPKDYPLIQDLPSLVWFAQVAAVELHVPQWRFTADGERGTPDRLVIDLDPGPGADLALCAHVASLARAILADIGLDPVPVTSGSKGIHLYCRLDGSQTSDQASALARELARAIEADHPDIATSVMAKAGRAGRVFLDWSQNNAAKTTVSPYSLRGRAHPTVAAPRTWDELDDPRLAQLTLTEVLARIADGIDPLRDFHPPQDDGLSPYRAKRDQGRTPEPVPDPAAVRPKTTGSPRFVIQEHHASRLHFDLRIEHDGVLVSWAVPKGVPATSGTNHLAVMTEPHPLEYLTFEGTIPRGEYGAGTMTVWDTGTVDLEKWREDEVIGTFSGAGPLGRTRLALIRTDGAGEKSTWLLHRMRAQAAATPRVPASAQPSPQEASPTRHPDPMLAEHGTPGLARAMPDAWAEIKWDGIRAVGVWHSGAFRLFARSGTDITARYPELTADGAPHLAVDGAVIDGEIISLDATGRPSFARLQNRMHLTRPREIEREVVRTPVSYQAFDLIGLDDRDLTRLPLRERRALLETLLSDIDAPIAVPPVFDDIDAALSTSRSLGLEGIVVKDARSPYAPGIRSDHWLKIKHTRTQEVVVVGIRPGKGNRAGSIGSLLLAIPTDAGLRYVGRVGTGFTDRMLRDLSSMLAPLRVDSTSVAGVPVADASDAQWLHPEIVGEVEFANWTPDGVLRHARWRGVRPDKGAADIVVEG